MLQRRRCNVEDWSKDETARSLLRQRLLKKYGKFRPSFDVAMTSKICRNIRPMSKKLLRRCDVMHW